MLVVITADITNPVALWPVFPSPLVVELSNSEGLGQGVVLV